MTTPLHGGKAPAWLFRRMIPLAGEIATAVVYEFGTEELLRRVSDPLWFQALGCVLGFDWHSSGVTTTTCGALKEGIKDRQHELGVYICGGKGARSRQTPGEIEEHCQVLGWEPNPYVRLSKLSAKVDNNALQDGYQLYHHNFFFDLDGRWSVVQQGMNTENRTARRYHWHSVGLQSMIEEPHAGICTARRTAVYDLTARSSATTRDHAVDILHEGPDFVLNELTRCKHHSLPARHALMLKDINPDNIRRVLIQTYEQNPTDFSSLLEARGAGPKTVRALTLLAEIIYGTEVSRKDPAVFAFAHGGKDGTPFPVERDVYDQSIETLRTAVQKAKVGERDKLEALKRLSQRF